MGLASDKIRAQRAVTLGAAYAANPAPFRYRPPSPPKLPTVAWINEPTPGTHQIRMRSCLTGLDTFRWGSSSRRHLRSRRPSSVTLDPRRP